MDHNSYQGHDHQNQSNPSIILRKGKTELKIENASAIIKRINEMHPAEDPYEWPCNKNRIKRDINDKEVERQKKWIESAKDWFKTEMLNELENFEVTVEENSTKKCNNLCKEESEQIVENKTNTTNEFSENTQYYSGHQVLNTTDFTSVENFKSFQPIKTVNKNAYELRCIILENAINVVNKYSKPNSSLNENVENIMEICNKFYSFVENKNHRKY